MWPQFVRENIFPPPGRTKQLLQWTQSAIPLRQQIKDDQIVVWQWNEEAKYSGDFPKHEVSFYSVLQNAG